MDKEVAERSPVEGEDIFEEEESKRWTEEEMAKAVADSDIKMGDVVFCLRCMEEEPVLRIYANSRRDEDMESPRVYYDHWDSEHQYLNRCSVPRSELVLGDELGVAGKLIKKLVREQDIQDDRIRDLEKRLYVLEMKK